jgi:hypothetical protein
MNILLDILGSVVTGGMVLLIHFGLISRMSTVAADLLLSNLNANDAIEVTKIIENDFYKIGYRDTTGNIFELAQQNAIQFKAPVKQDSLPKSINYYIGSTSQMLGTKNPNDKPLFRQVAGENAMMIGVVRDFNLIYLDSVGNIIDYSDVKSQAQRKKIRGVNILMKIESSVTVTKDEKTKTGDDIYPFVEWKKTIFPKNTRAL